MGNGILGRLAARRQTRIENRNQQYCQRQVYYHRPRTQVQSAIALKQSFDFSTLAQNKIRAGSSLGQWLEEERKTKKINMYKLGDVHIMEIKGKNPGLKFFDKTGNKWQALSKEQVINFYQAKEKINKQNTKQQEEKTMGTVETGVPNRAQGQGLINGNNAKADTDASSKSDSKAGSSAIAGAGVVVNNHNGDEFTPNSIKNSFSMKQTQAPDGTVTKELKFEGNASGFFAGDDINLFSPSIEASGNAVANSGEIGDSNAIGSNASNNGLSTKDKSILTKLLNRNNSTTQEANKKIIAAFDKAKKALQVDLKGVAKSANTAEASSSEASANSKAALEASKESLKAFQALDKDLKAQVKGAIDGLAKELKDLTEVNKTSQNETISKLVEQKTKEFAELKQAMEKIQPDIAKYIDKQTKAIQDQLTELATEQKAQTQKPAAKAPVQDVKKPDAKAPVQDAKKPDAQAPVKDAKKPDAQAPVKDENQTTRVIAWREYAQVA